MNKADAEELLRIARLGDEHEIKIHGFTWYPTRTTIARKLLRCVSGDGAYHVLGTKPREEKESQ